MISPAPVTLVGDFAVYDGYGSMNLYMARGMHRAGARVNVVMLIGDLRGSSPEFVEILARSSPGMDGPVLVSTWLHRPGIAPFVATEFFARTMCEGSGIPKSRVPRLNKARALIVPSRFVADVFRSCGVTAPLAVVPDGVDPEVYPYEPRPQRSQLTTLMVGAMQPRKHYREGVAAWQLAFQDDPTARLIIKSRMGHHDGFHTDDPRIEVHTDSDRRLGIAHYYRQADVLMALGNEGFGLPLIEGMATGLPVIALDAEGQADVCRDAGDLVLRVQPEDWEPNLLPDRSAVCGVRAVPGVEDVAAKLRWVAEHRDEAQDLGRAASTWAHRHRNVWSYGPDVLAAIEERSRCRRRLRRRDAQADRHLVPGRSPKPNSPRRVVPVVLTCDRDLSTFRIFTQSLKGVLPVLASPVVVVDRTVRQSVTPNYLRLIGSLRPAAVHQHLPQAGSTIYESVQHASHFALERVVEATRPNDLILFIEDDIVFSRWFPEVLRRCDLKDDAGFLSFYVPQNPCHSTVVDPMSFYGAQCLLMRRRVASELVQASERLKAFPPGWDLRWSRFLAEQGYRIYATHYSFVQHIGRTRMGNVAHRSRCFVP